MKFISIIQEEIQTEQLSNEYKTAHIIGRLAIGDSTLFYKKGLKVFYIPYSKIYRAFRRVKGIPARICCGTGEIQLHYIVVSSNKEELAEFDMPDERSAVAALEEIQAKSPKTKIGKKQ